MVQLEVQTRPDMDIEDDIRASLRSHSPLKAAQHFFKVQSTNGKVRVSGNIGSPQAKRVLLNYITKISGVSTIDMSDLYDDEYLRLIIGGMAHEGLLVNVLFGRVLLDSTLPDGNQETLRRVRSVAGIRNVVMRYQGIEININ